MGMKYVNIGTDTLVREHMNTIIDTEVQVKPAGGLWCTECACEHDLPWLNYMLYKPSVFFRKAPKDDPFIQKAVLVNLKTGAKIFELHGEEGREILSAKYKMSYEALSNDFDGVYVNLHDVFGRDGAEKERNFRLFSVSSLILFNLDCIDSYQKMRIEIEPFDYYDYDYLVAYYSTVYPEKYTIGPSCPEYNAMVENIATVFRNFILYEREKYPNISTNQIVYLLSEKVKEYFKAELETLSEQKGFDVQKLAYSISSNAVSRVK